MATTGHSDESDGAGNENAQCVHDYGGVYGQTNRPVLTKSQLKRRRRKVRVVQGVWCYQNANQISVVAGEGARLCVGKAKQCIDDRVLQGKGKTRSSGEAENLAQACVQ